MSYTKIASAEYGVEIIEIFQLDSTGDVPLLKDLIVSDMVFLEGSNSRQMISNIYVSELQLTIVDRSNFFIKHFRNRKSADFYCKVSKLGVTLFYGQLAPKITPHKWYRENNLVTILFSISLKPLESSRVTNQSEIEIGPMLLDIINDLSLDYDLLSATNLLHDNISVPGLIWNSYKIDRSIFLEGLDSPNKKELFERFLQTFNLECRFFAEKVYIIKKDYLITDPLNVENYSTATSSSVSLRKGEIILFDPNTSEIEYLPPVLELKTIAEYIEYDWKVRNQIFSGLSAGEFTDWEVEGNVRQNLSLSRNAIFEDINPKMEQTILRHLRNPDSVSFHIEADFKAGSGLPDGVYTFGYCKIIAQSEDSDLLYLTKSGWSTTDQSLETTITFINGDPDGNPSINLDIENVALPLGPTKSYTVKVILDLTGDTNALASVDPAEYKEISTIPVNISDQTEKALYQSLNTSKDIGSTPDDLSVYIDDKNVRNLKNGFKYLDATHGEYLSTTSFSGLTLHHRLQADHLSLVTDQPAFITFSTHYNQRPTMMDVIQVLIDGETLLFLPTRIESSAKSKVCTVFAHQLKKLTAIEQNRFFS